MTPEVWRQVKSLLDRALERPPAELDRWLDEELADEPELRAEVVSLLAAYDAGNALLEPPASGGSEMPDPGRVGERIGAYRLVRELGRGGMGVVYLAERQDEAFEQVVALKLIQAGLDSAEIERRFLQERQILARLDHPGIARLLDGGRTGDGCPYLVMEYVEGQPIDAYCREHASSLGERLDLFAAICSAVDFAHRNLVVHRDLKPGNVLVTADGTPKLLDFGIAKLLHAELTGQTIVPTRAGLRVMTPEYASPEQMRGDSITTATDVYSLGVMLYELLTGQRPYDLQGRALPEIARVICEQEATPPSAALHASDRDEPAEPPAVRQRVGRRLRGDLDAIVLKALRKEPAARYASAEQLAADLQRLREGQPVLARQGSTGYRISKFVLRHRLGVAAALGFLVLLVAFAASMALQVARTRRALAQAEGEAAKSRAVETFLEDTLGAANPETSEGRQPTIRDALDRAGQRLESAFASQPEIEAAVQQLVGKLYSNLGRYDDAEPLLRRALATRRRLLPAAHEDLAETLETLGLLLGRSGRATASRPVLQEALAMRQRLHGHWDAGVAKDLDLLAREANVEGDSRRAVSLEREALEVYRRTLDKEDPTVVHVLSSLADFERESGDLDAAEGSLKAAVAALDTLPQAPLATRGELETDLGELLETRGRNEQAEAHYRAGLDAYRRAFGEEHHWVAQGLVHLGTVLTREGRYDEAEGPLRQGVAILQRKLSPDHPDVAAGLNNLAFLLAERGDLEEATRLFGTVLAIQRKNLPDHPSLSVTLRNLGFLEMRQGRYREARRQFEEALAIDRRHLGESHPNTVRSRLLLAWAIGELGDWRQAAGRMREACTALAAIYQPEHPRLAEARVLLGLSLTRTGQLDEAEGLLLRALPVLRQAHGPHNHRVVQALATLVELYQARGEAAEVATYRAQLAAATAASS